MPISYERRMQRNKQLFTNAVAKQNKNPIGMIWNIALKTFKRRKYSENEMKKKEEKKRHWQGMKLNYS